MRICVTGSGASTNGNYYVKKSKLESSIYGLQQAFLYIIKETFAGNICSALNLLFPYQFHHKPPFNFDAFHISLAS